MVLIIFYLLASFTCWDLFWISDIDQWDAGRRLLFALMVFIVLQLDAAILLEVKRKYK